MQQDMHLLRRHRYARAYDARADRPDPADGST